MESNMVEVFILDLMELKNKESGLMGKRLNGWNETLFSLGLFSVQMFIIRILIIS